MDCLVSAPCPDCGAMVTFPAHVEGIRIVPDNAELPEMQRHIEFNPEIHPSFMEVD